MKRRTMTPWKPLKLALAVAGSLPVAMASSLAWAEAGSVAEAIKGGKVNLNMNLRYEDVDQDNALDDAEALTLRTRLTYSTDSYKRFSAVLGFEDVRKVLGVDDYNDLVGSNPGSSVIADPEVTEVDQAFVQYGADWGTIKYGRQVIAYDNQRFIGHVGWRQDRQTFDALSAALTPVEGLTVNYAYVTKRNRIVAEEADVDSKDHLLNASYALGPGKLTAYAYLLEVDDTDAELDTYGIRYAGSSDLDQIKLLYTLEFATQEAEPSDNEANYYNLEFGAVISGITAKLGYEVLGSDDGGYGFATPLATGHAFNGWADQFLATPAQGLEDLSLSVSGALAGGKWMVVYHDFSAEESSGGVDDLGSEIDAVYTRPFADHYVGGIKYAAYSAKDGGKVDTDKVWLFVTANF